MIPLNDDWLSWPPEALERFFNEPGEPDEPQPSVQVNNNESRTTDINH